MPITRDPQLNLADAKRLQTPTSWWIQIMGRLKPESTFAQVAGNLEGPFREAARAGVSVLTGVTFGLVPALRATSVDLGTSKGTSVELLMW